ncbi:ApeA N-terminal domain 1-containing protein [Algoriphagus marinus]|uniref:ApeA N-terminal domain 1-containing protein n=1 Tax=Algoriphagus marinus TaxID=1925762 RepID=UPI00094B9E35|nr:HEPN domain-containing protein [Algoriphagus marinus]
MNDLKEFKGFWCLPEKPETMIPGIAKFDPESGVTLELIGSFHEELNLFFNHNLSSADLIYGVDSNHKKISLVYCDVAKHEKVYKAKFSLIKYRVRYLLEGIHLKDVHAKIFSRGNFNTDKLNKWFLRNNIRNSYTFNSENEITGFSISFDSLKNRFIYDLKIDDFWLLEIVSKSWQQEKDFNGININEIYIIKISSVEPSAFLDIVKKSERLLLFFELAFTSKVKFISFYLFDHEPDADNLGNKSIALYYKQRLGLRDKSPYDRPVFNFNHIENSLNSILCNWMAIDSKLEPILNYLVKSFQNDNYFDTSNFMIIVNALEGFHRRFRNDGHVDLKVRLDFLFDEFQNVIDIGKIKLDSFRIARNRHYYSHFYEKDFQYLYDLQGLVDVTFELRKLLYCCILKQIGFNDALLKNVSVETL